jgi:DNA-directed RNA polymerase specialized sigma24 family protein
MKYRERELHHFLLLDPQAQREAIMRLAASGMSDSTIAAACGLAVEQIRRVIGEQKTKGSAA